MSEITTTRTGGDDVEEDSDSSDVPAAADEHDGDVATSGDDGDGGQLALAAGPAPEEPVKDRLLIPLLLPFLCMIAVALYVLNVSRRFLAGDSTSALGIAAGITVSILVGGTIISASPRLR